MVERNYLDLAAQQGWSIRSVPEARVAYRLARFGISPKEVVTQAKVGKFRLDFALPDVKVAIEVDGPLHRLPEMAVKDLERDLWLVHEGWMVFRVDAYGDEKSLQERLVRIVRFIRSERLGQL
jgi:very-short-patch-repair endonuclease